MATPESDLDSNPFLQEQSWNLLSLLLRIGHPVDAEYLASHSNFFTVSSDFVRYVASLPDSPLSVNTNGLLIPSVNAVFAFARFFSFHFPNSTPSPNRKRKSIFALIQDERDRKRLAIGEKVPEIFVKSVSYLALLRDALETETMALQKLVSSLPSNQDFKSFPGAAVEAVMRRNFCAIKFESQIMHGGNSMIPIDSTGECSGFSELNFKYREADNDGTTNTVQGEISGSLIKNSKCFFTSESGLKKLEGLDRFAGHNPFPNHAPPTNVQDQSPCNEAVVGIESGMKRDCFDSSGNEYPEQSINHYVVGDRNNTCKGSPRESNEKNKEVERGSKEGLINYDKDREVEDIAERVNPVVCGVDPTKVYELKKGMHLIHILDLDKHKKARNMVTRSNNKEPQSSLNAMQLIKSSHTLKGGQKNDLQSKNLILTESLVCDKCDNVPKKIEQCKIDQNISAKIKLKPSHKENLAEDNSMTSKVEEKTFPSFDSYIIEEEEGSGGYGIVYRAQRTTDGKRLAIKCPHINAHKNHVNNERNMLERFGGKNFIIKYLGSFKSGNSDCFVLEHVEHERPEVLKKVIDVSDLRWYAFCMFKALACLHKEGVVHRDVKPGNFLFSRKLQKGYLIDFNLAMDLKQKHSIGSKSKPSVGTSSNIPLPSGPSPVVQDKNLGGIRTLTSNRRELADYRKYSEFNRHTKPKANAGHLKNCPDKTVANLRRAQGTDGSGITSAKDVTSTKTASADRLREPLPLRGRKELISLAQNSMQCASNSSMKSPSSQRKRITAPSGKVDGRSIYLTPMPIHSSTVAVGLLRSKGDGKHKREGPCVGTKGFRAPEVLFRSQFQGPKVDIWSAGVTLLYMLIGKTSFPGEPEQSLKEIAKLRGSEELWEVAKLHDREASFPAELFDDQYLQSHDIETWCKNHTKRPEFVDQVPKSLFDLIDKCLTVNPRSRISVEDVLKHEFFASCNHIIRKQRIMRRGLGLETVSDAA